jgi:hypothetical protein
LRRGREGRSVRKYHLPIDLSMFINYKMFIMSEYAQFLKEVIEEINILSGVNECHQITVLLYSWHS